MIYLTLFLLAVIFLVVLPLMDLYYKIKSSLFPIDIPPEPSIEETRKKIAQQDADLVEKLKKDHEGGDEHLVELLFIFKDPQEEGDEEENERKYALGKLDYYDVLVWNKFRVRKGLPPKQVPEKDLSTFS